jgi:hypothetical protein
MPGLRPCLTFVRRRVFAGDELLFTRPNRKLEDRPSSAVPLFDTITATLPVPVSRDSSVGVVTRYGLDCAGDRIPVGPKFFAPVQTGPWAHPASYTMGTVYFPGGKAAVAWR